MFCFLKLKRNISSSILRKSNNWLISSRSRFALRSMILRLFLVCSFPSPDKMIFSNGAAINESGVRISCAILVKKLILDSYISFSLAVLYLNSFSWFLRSINRWYLRMKYKIKPMARIIYRQIIILDIQNGGFILMTMLATSSLHIPSLFVPFTRKVYVPAGIFMYMALLLSV